MGNSKDISEKTIRIGHIRRSRRLACCRSTNATLLAYRTGCRQLAAMAELSKMFSGSKVDPTESKRKRHAPNEVTGQPGCDDCVVPCGVR